MNQGAVKHDQGAGGALGGDDAALRRQATLIGSWTFNKQGQADCARFVVEHGIDVERLFTHRFQLEDAEAAYELFDTQTTGKGVFEF